MAGLFARLFDPTTGLDVHKFRAGLGEVARGKATRQGFINAFNVQAGAETTDLDNVLGKLIAPPESYAIGGFQALTGVGTAFDSTAQSKGLGILRVESLGVTQAELWVKYNKTTAGTPLTFELFEDTTSTSLITLIDSAATGDNRELVDVFNFVTPLPAGARHLRLRVKNSSAGATVTVYGGNIRLQRTNVLFANIVEDVLELASKRVTTYDTEAAIKTRLGIP